MNWIIFVIIAIIANVFRVYIENYITDIFFKGRHSAAQRFFYGIFYIVVGLALAAIFQPDFSGISLSTFFLFFASGIFASLAGIPYFRALECDDSTNLGIFFQFAPVLYLVASWLFLDTPVTIFQIISIPVILAAPILIVINSKKRSRHLRVKTMFLMLFSMAIEVVSSLIFVGTDDPNIHFINRIIPLLLGHGLANALMVVLYPKWRKRFFDVIRRDKKHKLTFSLFACSVTNIIKLLAYRAALLLAPTVALASAASDAVSPIAIFFTGIVLTLVWPNFGREKLTKKSILTHLASTILIAIGIVLMQL